MRIPSISRNASGPPSGCGIAVRRTAPAVINHSHISAVWLKLTTATARPQPQDPEVNPCLYSNMSFSSDVITEFVSGMPEGSLMGCSSDKKKEWVSYFIAVDTIEAQGMHNIAYYGCLARHVGESFGSICIDDYVIEGTATELQELVKLGARPYAEEENEPWKSFVVSGAQRGLVLRFVKKVQQEESTEASPPSMPSVTEELTATMQKYITAQERQLDRESKKHVLSFDVDDRLREVGLQNLANAARPTEEGMLKVESSAKVAKNQGRAWLGSTDGEDLQTNFRPSWTRTPKIDMSVGQDNLEDRMRSVFHARRERTMTDKISYLGFATFQGHVLDWGIKMVTMKVFSSVDLLSYIYILTQVSEEFGGSKMAFQYDILIRQEMAKTLERKGDITKYFTELNVPILDTARLKVNVLLQQQGRDSARGKGEGKPSGSKSGFRSSTSSRPHGHNDRSRSPYVQTSNNKGKGGKGQGKPSKSGKGQNTKGANSGGSAVLL